MQVVDTKPRLERQEIKPLPGRHDLVTPIAKLELSASYQGSGGPWLRIVPKSLGVLLLAIWTVNVCEAQRTNIV